MLGLKYPFLFEKTHRSALLRRPFNSRRFNSRCPGRTPANMNSPSTFRRRNMDGRGSNPPPLATNAGCGLIVTRGLTIPRILASCTLRRKMEKIERARSSVFVRSPAKYDAWYCVFPGRALSRFKKCQRNGQTKPDVFDRCSMIYV